MEFLRFLSNLKIYKPPKFYLSLFLSFAIILTYKMYSYYHSFDQKTANMHATTTTRALTVKVFLASLFIAAAAACSREQSARRSRHCPLTFGSRWN
jgi:hypothetical protein